MKTIGFSSLLLAAAIGLAAQSPAPTKAPDQPKVQTPAAIPQLTELEAARVENVKLRSQLLQQEQMQLTAAYNDLVRAILAEHPGFLWDPQTDTLKRPQLQSTILSNPMAQHNVAPIAEKPAKDGAAK
jgi:hypothetical protein